MGEEGNLIMRKKENNKKFWQSKTFETMIGLMMFAFPIEMSNAITKLLQLSGVKGLVIRLVIAVAIFAAEVVVPIVGAIVITDIQILIEKRKGPKK